MLKTHKWVWTKAGGMTKDEAAEARMESDEAGPDFLHWTTYFITPQ